MAFPPYADLAKAAVEFLTKRGGQATSAEVATALAHRFDLSDAALRKTLDHTNRPKGESLWKLTLRRVKFNMQQHGELAKASPWGTWKLR